MTLAIIAPQIGVLSETFIRRHTEDLLPGRTVVVAGTDRGPYGGHWDIECPKLIFNRLSLAERGFAKIAKMLIPGYLKFEVQVERFLCEHKVKVILGEYLHISVPWLPLAQKLGIPFFAHAHGLDVSYCLSQEKEKWQTEYLRYNQAAGVIVVNQVMRQRLIALGVAPEIGRAHV